MEWLTSNEEPRKVSEDHTQAGHGPHEYGVFGRVEMRFDRVIEGFIMYVQGLRSRVCRDEALKQMAGEVERPF